MQLKKELEEELKKELKKELQIREGLRLRTASCKLAGFQKSQRVYELLGRRS